MTINTTVYAHITTRARIDRIRIATGTSWNDAAVMLLARFMRAKPARVKTRTAVRYQGDDRPDAWRTMHIQMSDDDYEFFTDMRKLFKMSVSLLLALAVQHYQCKGIKKDNNPYSRHEIRYTIGENHITWHITWKTDRYGP